MNNTIGIGEHSDIIETIDLELEKLWDDIDAGKFGETAKTGKFYTDVKAIKEKYPKP